MYNGDRTFERAMFFIMGAGSVGLVALIVWASSRPDPPCVEGAPTPIVSMVGKVPVTNYYCLHSEHKRVGFYCKCPIATQAGDGGIVER